MVTGVLESVGGAVERVDAEVALVFVAQNRRSSLFLDDGNEIVAHETFFDPVKGFALRLADLLIANGYGQQEASPGS